ncbi:MAG: sigma-54-dependent Fis family transcriptional regulator [Rhodospirillales bacterium]|nr:sigma-54-dependent Fis family transcriptional regulator [Rhodospirillales bacterium]
MAHDILIVDDEADIRTLTAGILDDEGFQARSAATAEEALAGIATRRPNLVLLDIWLQGSKLDGLDVLRMVKRDNPGVPIVMMSGHGTIETAVTAIKEGAYDFIEKPFTADRMILMVGRALESARLRAEIEELRMRAGPPTDVIGQSAAMAQLRQAIERVAPTNSRVLIAGPSGSGKEVVARMMHAQSRRADGPFVVIGAATLDPARVEIELFGTEGAGVDGGRQIGTFERAHNGTLLLDEVTDMPLETQGKIVRVLQEQTFQRVGGSQRVEVNVRVIASTSRDLSQAIQDGRFREDLFYRLNVVPIGVPPLRERREDILPLAEHFMGRAAEAVRQPPRRFGEDAVVALQGYAWPGNVRELRNTIERLLILSPSGGDQTIRADMLPTEIVGTGAPALHWDRSAEIMTLPLREARELFERDYLAAQIMRFGGNVSRTAEFVGMERSALHRKLKLLGVGEDPKRRAETD